VITSVQRRRRWPTAEKIRLVEETMQSGMSVSYVAPSAATAHGAAVPDGSVSDREVRHLISTGYLALESREVKAAVAIALEA
jgi:hypothetical protein